MPNRPTGHAHIDLARLSLDVPFRRAGGDEPSGSRVHVSGNVVYIGRSSSAPEIGDVRVTLTKIMPAEISILGKVYGTTFEEFIASNGKAHVLHGLFTAREGT